MKSRLVDPSTCCNDVRILGRETLIIKLMFKFVDFVSILATAKSIHARYSHRISLNVTMPHTHVCTATAPSQVQNLHAIITHLLLLGREANNNMSKL